MYDQGIFLTKRSTRASVLLPFHLVWYGRLSKKQGVVALGKRLIVPSTPKKSSISGRTVRLTNRGRRGLEDFLTSEGSNVPRVFAHLLKEWGHVTEEPFYVYADTPLIETWDAEKTKIDHEAGIARTQENKRQVL